MTENFLGPHDSDFEQPSPAAYSASESLYLPLISQVTPESWDSESFRVAEYYGSLPTLSPRRYDMKVGDGSALRALLGEREAAPKPPLPERTPDEDVPDYLRRIFALTPEEKEGLSADCNAFVAKVSRQFGTQPIARRVARQDTEYLKWAFMGEPGDVLPQAVMTEKSGKIVRRHSFSGELHEIELRYGKRVREIAIDHKDELTELIKEDIKKTPEYALMASFMEQPDMSIADDVPLSDIEAANRLSKKIREIGKEFGIKPDTVARPYDVASRAAYEQLRAHRRTLLFATERQSQPEHETEDPFSRLAQWTLTHLKTTWEESYPDAGDFDVSSAQHHLWLLKPFKERPASDFSVRDSAKIIIESMCGKALSEHREVTYEQALSEAVDQAASRAFNNYPRESTHNMAWLRKPRYVYNEPEAFFPPINQSMVTNEVMDTLRSITVASITRDERTPKQKTQARLLLWKDATDLPEVSDIPPTLTLSFNVIDDSGESRQFVPEGTDPHIPGFTVIAARETTEGKEYDFTWAEYDPYQPCPVSLQENRQVIANFFHNTKKGDIHVLADAVQAHEGDNFTVADLGTVIRENSVYHKVSSQYVDSIVVKDGIAHMQCEGTSELLSGGIASVFSGGSAYPIRGLVLTPYEDTITLLGHAQVEFNHGGQQYICDATPRESVPSDPYRDILNALLSGDVELDPELLSQLLQPSPQPIPQEKREAAIKECTTTTQHEQPDSRIYAQEVIDIYPQQINDIRCDLEEAIRIRLHIESDRQYEQRDAFYAHVLKTVPDEEHPLRLALANGIHLHQAATAHRHISGEGSAELVSESRVTLDKIEWLTAADPTLRKQVYKLTDDMTLTALRVHMTRLLHAQQEVAAARETLRSVVD